MTHTFDVIAMGRSLVDLYPREDGPLESVTGFDASVGGSPTNVAIAAARLGRRAAVISRVGDDGLGRLVQARLEEFGVDVTQVLAIPGRQTAVAICEISPPDHFPLTIYRPEPAADLAIDADSIDAEAVAGATVFWVSLSGLAGEPSREAHRRMLASRTAGWTVLDLDFRPSFWASEADASDAAREAIGRANVLVGNLDECRIALGTTDPEGSAEAMLAAGARLAIVKLGAEGVLARTATERVHAAPIPVAVANGLGAGDAFGGALCHGLLSEWSLEQTIGFANAAGAIVASRRGCASAMPTESDVNAVHESAGRAAG